MNEAAPKTIAEARTKMHQAVRIYRERSATANPTARDRLATQARRAIERLRKQFQHKIDDQLRRDAKQHRGISESERMGLEKLLHSATENSLKSLQELIERYTVESSCGNTQDTEPSIAPVLAHPIGSGDDVGN